MRIAIVTETWHPHIDGVIIRLNETIRCLRRWGHDVLVIAPHRGESSFEGARVCGVPTFRVPFIHGGQPWGYPLPRVGNYLDEFRPDVVHVINPIMLGIAGVVAARRRGLPLVCSYHTDLTGYAADYHLRWLTGVIRRLTRGLHNAANVNLATSSAACNRLRSLGVSNVHLWRRGVDLDLFRPDRRTQATREQLGAADGEPLRQGNSSSGWWSVPRNVALSTPAGRHTFRCITSVVGCGGGTVRRFSTGRTDTAWKPSRSNIATVPPW